jgi:hypothetical protein
VLRNNGVFVDSLVIANINFNVTELQFVTIVPRVGISGSDVRSIPSNISFPILFICFL